MRYVILIIGALLFTFLIIGTMLQVSGQTSNNMELCAEQGGVYIILRNSRDTCFDASVIKWRAGDEITK
jgi:hypothetical protein